MLKFDLNTWTGKKKSDAAQMECDCIWGIVNSGEQGNSMMSGLKFRSI